MLHGDAVDEARRGQRHVSHVEHSVVAAAHALQQVGDFRTENSVGLLHRKAVMSGGHRGVGGKYTTAADRLRIPLVNRPVQVAAQLEFHQTDGQKRGVTFIHVVNGHVVIQGFEHAHATDSQNGFLAQAIVRIPTVEVIGELSIARVVLRQICVEEVDGDGVPGDSFEVVSPGADHHRPVLDRHLDQGVFERQKFFERPGLIFSALDSLGIEMLLEISFAMQQGDGA